MLKDIILPSSSLIQLMDFKNSNPSSEIILISMSPISDSIKRKLNELNIKTFIKPTNIEIVNYFKGGVGGGHSNRQ